MLIYLKIYVEQDPATDERATFGEREEKEIKCNTPKDWTWIKNTLYQLCSAL